MSVQPNINRDPSEYEPTNRFGQEKKWNDVPGAAVRKCIERGRLFSGDGANEVECRAEFGNQVYTVVLNLKWMDAVDVRLGE
jgi:hypothetical protein